MDEGLYLKFWISFCIPTVHLCMNFQKKNSTKKSLVANGLSKLSTILKRKKSLMLYNYQNLFYNSFQQSDPNYFTRSGSRPRIYIKCWIFTCFKLFDTMFLKPALMLIISAFLCWHASAALYSLWKKKECQIQILHFKSIWLFELFPSELFSYYLSVVLAD